MKTVARTVCATIGLLALVGVGVRGGELNILGNLNVASNVTFYGDAKLNSAYQRFDFGGGEMTVGRYNAEDLGYGTAFHRAGDAYLSVAIGWGNLTALLAMADDSGTPTELSLNCNGGQVSIASIYNSDGFNVGTNAVFAQDVTIEGKLNVNGGMDPPYVLLDAETRDSVAQRVAREVPPSKQTGAALFWNSTSKQVEVYVASEGSFYNLSGKLVEAIAVPKVAGAVVTQTYRVDPATGAVVTQEKVQAPRWQLKLGYQFDKKSGEFFQITSSNAPPVAVTQEQALELR